MDIISAINSGHSFRPDPGSLWFRVAPSGNFFEVHMQSTDHWERSRGFSPAELVSDRWEIEEKSVTITEHQFWDAAHSSMELVGVNPGSRTLLTLGDSGGVRKAMMKLARELGFNR